MKDKHKTKVNFLYHEKTDDLMAFFPDICYNNWNSGIKTCYSHIGQHSACAVEYANECRQATIEEYIDLQKELEGIGYNLTIIDKTYYENTKTI